jgi:hypothetical protein
MDTHGPQQGDAGGGGGWRNRRKRIVAREVPAGERPTAETTAEAAEVEQETRLAARQAIAPSELLDASYSSPSPQVDSLIVDPTQLVGERHRRHGANAKYRATQVSAGLSLLGAAVAIAMVFDDESTAAQVLAGVAVALAVLAVYLVRTSRLAYRLRGYAAAAGVLAVLAMAFSLVPNPFHEEPAPAPPAAQPDANNTP